MENTATKRNRRVRMSTPIDTLETIDTNKILINAITQGLQNRDRNEQMQAQQSMQALRDNKEFFKDVFTKAEGAQESIDKLNRMEQLNKEGKLTSPATYSFLKKIGLDFPFLLNTDSQEFEKLTNDLTKNIQSFYGARINVIQFKNFLKTIPTLSQSKEGREVVIKNLKKALKPIVMQQEELLKLDDLYGGNLPANTPFILKKRMGKIKDLYSKEIFQSGNPTSFKTLPDPAKYKGQRIKANKQFTPSGKPLFLESNGTSWEPVQE